MLYTTPLFLTGKPEHDFTKTRHATHLLKLVDKICKYAMDPSGIVEDTERTRFGLQTDGRKDTRTEI